MLLSYPIKRCSLFVSFNLIPDAVHANGLDVLAGKPRAPSSVQVLLIMLNELGIDGRDCHEQVDSHALCVTHGVDQGTPHLLQKQNQSSLCIYYTSVQLYYQPLPLCDSQQ